MDGDPSDHPALSRHIWFRSDRDLTELAELLGAGTCEYDAEHVWEWVVADIGDHVVDITRDHTGPAADTDTCLFVVAPGAHTPPVPADLVDHVVATLLEAGIEPVHLGTWSYVSGNRFEKVVRREFVRGPRSSPAPPP